jgi:hypothetical protein
VLCAVIMITGGDSGRFFNSLRNVIPSISGILTSLTMTSGLNDGWISSASRPLAASATSYPMPFRASRTVWRAASSSSTIKMR